jgi:hypothetical protein
MVILLRTLGIPSRLVNGFKEGEWNDAEGVFIVRQRDAHSWVEAYLDGVGWVAFDPTPAAGSPRVTRGRTFLALLRHVSDIMRLRWSAYVVSYEVAWHKPWSERLARTLILRVPEMIRELLQEPAVSPGASSVTSEGPPLWVKVAWVSVFGVMAVAVALLIARKAGWRPYVRGRRAPRTRTRVRFYRDLLKVLDKKGYTRWPHETPREFAESVVRHGGERFRPVKTITDRFHEMRYGGREMSRQEVQRIRDLLKEIAK